MDKYDLCIIGAGPSGYAAAMRAVDFSKRVVLIEKDKVEIKVPPRLYQCSIYTLKLFDKYVRT